MEFSSAQEALVHANTRVNKLNDLGRSDLATIFDNQLTEISNDQKAIETLIDVLQRQIDFSKNRGFIAD